MARTLQSTVQRATGSSERRRRESQSPLLIHLLEDFPFGADVAQAFFTDWVPVDSEFQNAQIHVHCQTIAPLGAATGLDVRVQTSFDTVEAYQVGSLIAVNAPSSRNAAISTELGPMVRVKIEIAEAFPMYAILSVWLQPKSD